MRVERIRVIAAATLFAVSGAALCLAGDPPIAAQYPTANPAPQAGPSQETPPARTQDQNAARNPYQPAKVVSGADVQFPFQTTADGVVVFSVSVGAGGEARKIKALNDVPPFTAAAQRSLRDWKFAPAAQNGRPEDSEMLVAFVFRHSVYIAKEPPFTPIIPTKESADTRRAFVPPGILSINYAGYPANTIAMGAVVVQASVKPDGSTGEVSVIRDLEGGFGPLAIKAAKHWKFQPALRNGRPVPSKVVIAFVFSSRALNPF